MIKNNIAIVCFVWGFFIFGGKSEEKIALFLWHYKGAVKEYKKISISDEEHITSIEMLKILAKSYYIELGKNLSKLTQSSECKGRLRVIVNTLVSEASLHKRYNFEELIAEDKIKIKALMIALKEIGELQDREVTVAIPDS